MQGVEDQDLRKRIERLEDLQQLLLVGGAGGGSGSGAFTIINANDTNAAVTAANTGVFFTNLSATRTAVLPAVPATGQIVVVKDEDGSLVTQDIVIDGNGTTIDGSPTYTMTLVNNEPKGAVMLMFNGTSWGLV